MRLTEKMIKKAKLAENKSYKLYDQYGLYVLVSKKSKRFYLRITVNGKQKDIALGEFPFLSLKRARIKVFSIKSELENGKVPPILQKKQNKTLNEVFTEFFLQKEKHIAKNTAKMLFLQYKNHIQPVVGSKKISNINTQDIFQLITKLQNQSKLATATQVRQILTQLFHYSILNYGLTSNPTSPIQGIKLFRKKTQHHKFIVDKDRFSSLLSSIEKIPQGIISDALKILPYVFVRQSELRSAEVKDFDLIARLWKIPKHKTKMRREHIVPLANQVFNILNERIEKIKTGYIFPAKTKEGYISSVSLTRALKNTGFDMSLHGFRSSAATFLTELGFDERLIEMQLSHIIRNHSTAAYNFAIRLEDRRIMMQKYADFLDSLKNLYSLKL